MQRRPWTKWSVDEEAEATRLYEQDGMSIKQLGEWFGRPVGSVYSMLTRIGVELRPSGKHAAKKATS